MPKMDPKLAALLKANPDRTPAEMYAVLYGQKGDIPLPPTASGPFGGLLNPFASIADRLKKAK